MTLDPDRNIVTCRMIDYYLKNLSRADSIAILNALDDVNPFNVKWCLEADTDYDTFRVMGLTDEMIQATLKCIAANFKKANETAAAAGIRPLFTAPDNTYQSAREYMELLREKPYAECIEIFGCTYKEYAQPQA